jgi:phospholipid/cholesterol/gamma-HCH transport system substrate-binding protein
MTDTSSDHRGGKISRAIRYVRTEPGLLRNVIAIAVVIVLGLGIGGTVLSQQRFTPPWESQRQVWATFSEAASVAPGLGQNVQINGVQVGQIQDAQIDNNGRALILMTIQQSKYDRPIYQNATVVMRPTTPLNTEYIELNPGTPDAPEVPDYGVLPLGQSTSPVQIDQPLAQLDDKTRDMARELLSQADVALARAPKDLPATVNGLGDLTQRLQPIAAQLDVRREKVKQLVTSLGIVAKTVGNNDVRLTQLADRLQVTLGAVASQNDALRDSFNQLPGVADRLRESTGAVQGLSDQLDPTLDNIREASDTLPGALNGLTRTVDTLDGTLDRLDPVAEKLRPTAADLRPFVRDLNRTFPDLKTIAGQLNPVTERLVPYLPDLVAFIYQANSTIGRADGQLRNSAHALVTAGAKCTLPGTCSMPMSGGDVPNTIFGEKLGKNLLDGQRLFPNTEPQYKEFPSNGPFVRTVR